MSRSLLETKEILKQLELWHEKPDSNNAKSARVRDVSLVELSYLFSLCDASSPTRSAFVAKFTVFVDFWIRGFKHLPKMWYLIVTNGGFL